MIFRPVTAVRRNHAIEHATVSVLLSEHSPTPFGGVATPAGFLIFGDISKDDVERAAESALKRLKEGQNHLAISKFCGTNLVISAVVAGTVTAIVSQRSKGKLRYFRAAALGMLAAAVLSGSLGNEVQKKITTLASMGDTEIRRVSSLNFRGYKVHFVRTS